MPDAETDAGSLIETRVSAAEEVIKETSAKTAGQSSAETVTVPTSGDMIKEESRKSSSETRPPEAKETAKSTAAVKAAEAPTTAHEHTWIEITQLVHHDAVYTSVVVPDQGHWEESTVTELVEEEWDEYVGELHMFCNTCGMDFTAAGLTTRNGGISNHLKENGHTGWHDNVVSVFVAHHDPVYETKVIQNWVIDVPAHTEQQMISPAWDETVVTGYQCPVCGAVK